MGDPSNTSADAQPQLGSWWLNNDDRTGNNTDSTSLQISLKVAQLGPSWMLNNSGRTASATSSIMEFSAARVYCRSTVSRGICRWKDCYIPNRWSCVGSCRSQSGHRACGAPDGTCRCM